MFEAYARKILSFHDKPRGHYEQSHLNNIVMELPFGEAHMALAGGSEKDLPKLGYGRSLQAHMQQYFFDVIARDVEAFEFTNPILIEYEALSALEHWREWQVLSTYLNHNNLEPLVLFRNKPHKLPKERGENGLFYVADVRVLFTQNFHYE